jgi:hypothetical protein
MAKPAAARQPEQPVGCLAGMWLLFKWPFLFLWMVPRLGSVLRIEAASATGARAQASFEQLTPPADRDACAAVLAEVRSHDPGFDLAATARGVVRARQMVDQARLTGDASAARQVLSDGLWQVLVMVLDRWDARGVRRQGTCTVTEVKVVAATRDQLAEQLRLRLECQGERSEVAGEKVLRGMPGVPGIWHEDWVVRRSATATTPENGGVLSGRCPQCGAALDVQPDGSCGYCKALVLTTGQDWVVWSIEEDPW